MRKRHSMGLNIGMSSILVIIVILCLVCFAGLSLASANADYQLSVKLRDRSENYYKAVSQANIDLYNAKKESPESENSFDQTYSLNENQVLHVTASNDSVTTFKIETVKEPEIDDSLSLLLGN